LNKIIGAVIAYGPKTKPRRPERRGRQRAAKNIGRETRENRHKGKQMTDQTDRRRHHELRNKALLYVYEHGARQPKGLVRLTDLKAHLEITDREWRPLYLLLRQDGLADTDSRNEHVYLTQNGRAEAEKLNR
jgi:hypothetical protein